MTEAIFVKYIKPGEWLPGVPARDMDRPEWEALPEEKRALGLQLGLYEIVPEEDAETSFGGDA